MSFSQYKAVWPVFALIPSKLRQKIKSAHVYGDGNTVLILTADDEVYSFGCDTNSYGMLGQGQGVVNLLEPKKIEVLSKKGIHLVAIGSIGFVVTATANGEIYTWGYGGSGNLGNGSTSNVFMPAAITANFGGNRILRISCGSTHTLLLTEAGQVFSWGAHSNGQLGNDKQTYRPERVTNSLDGKFVVDIACSSLSSFAVIDTGEMYAWGSNSSGELGNGSSSNSTQPVLVTSLRNVLLKQIVCGKTHFLALSKSGNVYACGNNTNGQLGDGTVGNKSHSAKMLQEKLGSFSQVAATHFSDLSAALSEEGDVYVWGFCRFQAVSSPMKTELASLDDAFACYSSPPVSWRPLPIVTGIPHGYRGDVLTCLKNSLYEDEDVKDVTFIVENKKIRAHKIILMIRCDYFRKMFQGDWAETKKEGIYVGDFTYVAFSVFLEYVYTGTVAGSLDLPVAVDLLQIADCYQERKLQTLCEETLKDRIKVDNCAQLFEISTKYAAKLLQTGCAKFGAHHMSAVISSDYFKQMTNPQIIQDFLFKAAQYGAFKY